MSRYSRIDSAVLGLVVGLLTMPQLALADVLEISGSSHNWVAGGPPLRSNTFPDAVTADTSEVLLTRVAPTAGPAQWHSRVAELAAKYDVSPALLEALVWQESRWRPNAQSHAGARGLAQLMPGTARNLGVDINNPAANLEGGVRYLRMQLDAFDGDLEKALAAYNAGPARVQRAGGIPRIRETQQYVASIMARLSEPARR